MLIFFYKKPFLLFFLSTFVLFWITPTRFKNSFLLFASYVFYGSWNIKYLALLFIPTLIDYFCGIKIVETETKKKKWPYLLISIIVNLTSLGFFKYYNFFISSFNYLLEFLGFRFNIEILNIVLPIGISFYTFQNLSYTIDIYKGRLKPTYSFIDFALFVSFFPQLIAGPIQRAISLLPQIEKKKTIRDVNFKEGTYFFIYGLFLKVALADSMNMMVETIANLKEPSSFEMLIGVYAYFLQIYCDFSGYSSMAVGIARFFDIHLSLNFNLPFFSVSPSDFWNRWHITLSSWVKTYIFTPLLLRTKSPYIAAFIALPVMGFWHGPTLNFLLWGVYWLILSFFYQGVIAIIGRDRFNRIPKFLLIFIMFNFAAFGLIIFKTETLAEAKYIILRIIGGYNTETVLNYNYFLIGFFFILIYETFLYYKKDLLFMIKKNFFKQALFYFLLYTVYLHLGDLKEVRFIYFQF